MDSLPTTEQLVELFNNGMLPANMASRFGLSDQQASQIVEMLATLHNAGTIDLLRLVEDGAIQSLDGSKYFLATHFFCKILPGMEESPSRVMRCVKALVDQGGQDGAANQPNAAFRVWCENNPLSAGEVIDAARNGDDLASHHLTFALEALKDVTAALQMVTGDNDELRLFAITALGRIADDDQNSRTETLTAFGQLIDKDIDDTLRGNLLISTLAILAQHPEDPLPEGTELIRGIVKYASEFTVHQAAHVLWAYRKALQPDIVESLLETLSHLKPTNKGTVRELDHGLEVLLNDGYDEAAIDFMTKLLPSVDDDLDLEEFGSFTNALLSGPEERLSRVVVQWLMLGEPSLCEGLNNILRGEGIDGPPLNLLAGDLDIPPKAQIFLCRKAIGWFFMKPTTTASILVSVLRVCDEGIAPEIQNLLFDPILVNYLGIKEYLEKLSSDDAAIEHINQAIEKSETYFAALRDMPAIKELRPSEHQRRIQQILQSDEMRDFHKQVQSKSVFLSMVKNSVLLYGKSSLSFVKGDKGELRPMEMDLKSHGISYEMPRMESIDPFGLDYMLRIFRVERMAQ